MSVPLEDIPVLEISRNMNKTYDKELNVETDGAIECQNMEGHRGPVDRMVDGKKADEGDRGKNRTVTEEEVKRKKLDD